MPEPQVAYDDATFFDYWLRRWSDFPASIEQVFLDPAACTVTVLTLLVGNSGISMSAEPYLSRAILRCHGDERNIDNKSKWDRGVVEVCIIMDGLGHRWGCFGRRQSCIAGHESQSRSRPKLGRSHLGDDWVCDTASTRFDVITCMSESDAY